MANPWDNDPVYKPLAKASAAGNPWDNDPVYKPLAAKSKDDDGTLTKLAKGAAMGLADVGNTVINAGVGAVTLGGKVLPEVAQWNRTRNADMDYITQQNKDSTAFSVGRVGANIAATYPVGGILGQGVKAVSAAPAAQALGNAIASGGFSTGAAPGGLNMLTRVAGGAINGGVSSALVNPSDAVSGAVIGGALPPALAVVGKGTTAAAKGIRNALTPESVRSAGVVLDAAEATTPEAIAQIRAALMQQGPSMIPGAAATVPQILQKPGVSQLQRTVKNAGDSTLFNREVSNNAAYLAALNGISPVTGTVQQAAENVGNMTQRFARNAEKDASQRISNLYDAVDPEDAARFFLPIEQMEKARSTFLGPGTFGSGNKAGEAISTARKIGTETVEAVKAEKAGAQETLLDAVRKAGGIRHNAFISKDFAGELRNLRESGLGNVVKRDSGQSVEKMAEKMHEAGFIPDEDPATLINFLHDHAAGNPTYAMNADMDGMYRLMAQEAQGAAPEAGTFAKTVPFSQLQNLRSSISEAANEAAAKGRNREAAALSKMIADIDSGVNKVGAGLSAEGEHFPADMAGRWRDANKAHADKMDRFYTGPQASMFRNGTDGQASAQGAELAGKFFNATRSQADDAKAFNKLIGDNTVVRDAMKNYAITDLSRQTNKLGMLTDLPYNGWLNGRSGAVRELFDPQEAALMSEIGKAVKAAGLAEDLGRASGSNTVQNAQNALKLGLLDNPLVNAAASKMPIIKAVSGPILDALRETARKSKSKELADLLANPEKLNEAIGRYIQMQQPTRLGTGFNALLESAGPAAYRAAPLLSSGQ